MVSATYWYTPVHYWNCENSSNVGQDKGSTKVSLANGVYASGKVGTGSCYINGVTGMTGTLADPSGIQTVDFWVNHTTLVANSNFVFSMKASNSDYTRAGPGDAPDWGMYVNVGVATWTGFNIANMTTNTWYHIVLVQNGSSRLVYLNGVLLGNSVNSGALFKSTYTTFQTSRPEGDYDMNGRIDNFAMFTQAYTPADVVASYNSGAGLDFLTPPNITTYVPANGSTSTPVNAINLTLDEAGGNCSIANWNSSNPINVSWVYDSGNTTQFNYKAYNASNVSQAVSLSNGQYYYNVSCWDSALNNNSGNYYTFTVADTYVIKGIVNYNSVAFQGATVLLINDTSNVVLANTTTNSTGGYIFNNVVNNVYYLVNTFFRNASVYLTKSSYSNVTVAS